MKKALSLKLPASRVTSDDIQKKEKVFGYFLGPCLVCIMYNGAAGPYLMQFYTDVLGISGLFLTLMPLISKTLAAFAGILFSRLIDRTASAQGKARPWILLSGFLLSSFGILMYSLPCAFSRARIIWIVFSSHLLFSLAFSAYTLSHALMVPLSTRDTKQRDGLALLTSAGTAIVPGTLLTFLMPLLVKAIGVGPNAGDHWAAVMSLLSAAALPGALIEYCFTRERVIAEASAGKTSDIPLRQQLSACLKDSVWRKVMLMTMLMNLCTALSSQSMLYYCNWVLGSSVDSGAARQVLVNVVGQAPLGVGVLILWPAVRKYGKKTVALTGFAIASLGSFAVLAAADRMSVVVVGLFVRSIGLLPTYLTSALLADAIDHTERRNGFRADTFSVSVNSILLAVVQGISQTVVLTGIGTSGYIIPESAAQVISQPTAVRSFFSWCFAGIPMICCAAAAVIMISYNSDEASGQSA